MSWDLKASPDSFACLQTGTCYPSINLTSSMVPSAALGELHTSLRKERPFERCP
jgi:hypothetical protein